MQTQVRRAARALSALLALCLLLVPIAKSEDSAMINITLGGFVGERERANVDSWLLRAPYVNPAMFEMFSARDKTPRQMLVPWYGEFPGKYLTSAVLCYRLGRDERLMRAIEYSVGRLIACQAPDGYLGVFPMDQRLVGAHNPLYPNDKHWDLWGHYHCMLGLLLHHRQTGDARSLQAAARAADYIIGYFSQEDKRIEDAGWGETNMSSMHSFLLLYEQTHDERYLEFAKIILKAFESPEGGDYLNAALAGTEFYQMRKPRWESLHAVQGLVELYWITGEERYKEAVVRIWKSIQKTDRHNTGGFSSGEQAQGSPYDPRAIETCCTVAWIALSIDVLKLTGDSVVADEIELSTLNGILGAQHPSGRYFTYNTPMDGVKISSETEIAFQSHPGSPELNCCSVNGPRGIGMISDWALVAKRDALTVNHYGEMDADVALPGGGAVTVSQRTAYPKDGAIQLGVRADRPLTLRLRVPFWSKDTAITDARGVEHKPEPGRYFELALGAGASEIAIALDMTPHFWPGSADVGNKVSVYVGPVLLAYDQRFGEMDPGVLPALNPASLRLAPVECGEYPAPWLLFQVEADGQEIRLCDFATAGATGMPYVSWLRMQPELPEAELDGPLPAWGYRP